MLGRVGFDGEEGEWVEYGRWLGLRHPRRIWGELMSNAMAVLIEAVIGRQQTDRQAEEKADEAKGRLIETLQKWEGACTICLAARGRREVGHSWKECGWDEFAVGMMREGAEQVGQMVSRGGGKWIPWDACGKDDDAGCKWCRLAGEVAIGLLYVGAEAVREWVMEDEQFRRGVEGGGEGVEALEGFFRREGWWGEVESNGLCELVRRWG